MHARTHTHSYTDTHTGGLFISHTRTERLSFTKQYIVYEMCFKEGLGSSTAGQLTDN